MEANKNCSYSNYYQKANFPKIADIAIFDTLEDFKLKFPSGLYICPLCKGYSKNPYECDTKKQAKTNSGICDWKAYGLFGCLGKGYTFTIKTEFLKNFKTNTIFKPIELL